MLVSGISVALVILTCNGFTARTLCSVVPSTASSYPRHNSFQTHVLAWWPLLRPYAVLCCALSYCIVAHRDLLSEPHRFVVMSIDSKLLVLVPTNTGHLVSVCVKQFARSDDLTNEVVKTIMAVRNTGQPILACVGMNSNPLKVSPLGQVSALTNELAKTMMAVSFTI